MNASVEFLWGVVINDTKYKNLNLTQVGTRINDGLPLYARTVPTLARFAACFEIAEEGSAPPLVAGRVPP